jgi:hypothetical protein
VRNRFAEPSEAFPDALASLPVSRTQAVNVRDEAALRSPGDVVRPLHSQATVCTAAKMVDCQDASNRVYRLDFLVTPRCYRRRSLISCRSLWGLRREYRPRGDTGHDSHHLPRAQRSDYCRGCGRWCAITPASCLRPMRGRGSAGSKAPVLPEARSATTVLIPDLDKTVRLPRSFTMWPVTQDPIAQVSGPALYRTLVGLLPAPAASPPPVHLRPTRRPSPPLPAQETALVP